jgi:long-chain fatty acid transport protein
VACEARLVAAYFIAVNNGSTRHFHICHDTLTQLSRPLHRQLVFRNNFVLLAAFAATLAPSSALAEGYYSGYKGAHAAGRGGAFVAKADDISAAHFNPAAFAWQKGTRIQLGNRFSYNHWAYQRAPTEDWGNPNPDGTAPIVFFDKTTNGAPVQALEPMLGVSTDFGLDDWGFALSASAPPGIGKMEFPENGGGRYMMVDRQSQIITYSASVAWKLRELFGLGVSFQWIAVPKLDYSLVVDGDPLAQSANPVSSTYDLLADVSGKDMFTFNAILGAWLRPAPNWEIGLSGQVIPSQIKTSSELTIETLGLPEDIVLRRLGEEANDVSLTLPLPMTARLGVRYYQKDDDGEIFDIEFDVGYETWSRVKTFDLDTDNLTAFYGDEDIDLGTIVIDKQWKNTINLHLGGDLRVIPNKLTLRAGTFFESAVANPDYSHIDFVSGMQLGGALGASLYFDKLEIALAYGFRGQPQLNLAEADAKVYQQRPASDCLPPYTDPAQCNEHYLGQPGPAVNAGSYGAYSHSLSVDLAYRF